MRGHTPESFDVRTTRLLRTKGTLVMQISHGYCKYQKQE